MKAYRCMYKGEEWVDYFHAENEKHARKLFFNVWCGDGEYIDTRVYRVPALDNLPLTGKNIADNSGYEKEDDEYIGWLNTYNPCRCDLCKGV